MIVIEVQGKQGREGNKPGGEDVYLGTLDRGIRLRTNSQVLKPSETVEKG